MTQAYNGKSGHGQLSCSQRDASPLVSNDAYDASTSIPQDESPFEKYIGINPIVAFGLTLSISWESVALTMGNVFVNGGPPALVWGMLLCLVGSSATAASLGEMASVDPAVGAQYRWAARFAPKSLYPQFWGYMQGWLTFVAWVAACASSPFAAALLIQSVAILQNPTYVPERWHTTLIGCAAAALPVIWNLWARRLFVAIELGTGLLHLSLFIVFVVVLGVLVPRGPSSSVWTTILANQPADLTGVSHGWTNPGVAFCVGLLTPALCITGAETKNAAQAAPKAMLLSVIVNGSLALGFSIVLMYCLGDVTVTLDPTKGYMPIVGVLLGATESKIATTVMMVFLITVVIVGSFSIFASVSRLTWAFAKDGGLPFSDYLSQVDLKLGVPLNALVLVCILCAALLCVNIGSTVAFYAVLSLATFGLFSSYCIPLLFLIISKTRGEGPKGSWQLGRFGLAINVFSLAYCMFLSVWLTFPVSLPVTASTMNYAAPIWGGTLIFAAFFYVLQGRNTFVVS